jgi:hypothetical protein
VDFENTEDEWCVGYAEKIFLLFFEDGVNRPPGVGVLAKKGGVKRSEASEAKRGWEILCVVGGSGYSLNMAPIPI